MLPAYVLLLLLLLYAEHFLFLPHSLSFFVLLSHHSLPLRMAKFTSTEGECTDVLVHHKLVGISVFDGSFTCDWNLELYAVACRIKAAHGSAISDGFRMWISRVEPGLIVRNFNESLREAFSLNSTSPFLVCDEAGKRYEVTVYYDFEPLDVRFPLLNIQLGK
uniref:Uncharacterized protein TCIL3000_10_12530 n=1 Tax=Trypanosoma congolense (strain IL3000) TaxID=1068625 RepID=G0UYK4_TRYCI|nr:unnamed protein product [Trypanosoma congolense IL3000]